MPNTNETMKDGHGWVITRPLHKTYYHAVKLKLPILNTCKLLTTKYII